jgi:hypothetical protein
VISSSQLLAFALALVGGAGGLAMIAVGVTVAITGRKD